MLPAEESGQIELMDQIVAVDGEVIENLSPKQVTEIFHELALVPTRLQVMLTVKSANHCNLWFCCPTCSSEVCIYKDEEEKLRAAHNRSRSLRRTSSSEENFERSSRLERISQCYCPDCKKYCSADDIFNYELFM